MIDSYRKLSIAKYDEAKKIMEKDIDDIDKQVELIACLADMDIDKVYNLPLTKYEELVEKASFLLELPKPKNNFPNKLSIGDRKYSIMKNVEKMTAGQYIDLQTYMKNDMSIAYILTTIIIPEGCEYNDGKYNIDDLQKDIYNNFNIEDAISIAFFLRRKLQIIIEGTLHFLDWKIKKIEKKMPQEQKTKMKKVREMLKMKKVREMLKGLETNGLGNIL